ncbi:hypothetical protein EIP91_000895 [Steccherinum ochraceum]|uniref:Nucleoside transporter n=1 Tax=Steccherinum ochraceum TaxID=92696 RepID=A0A4V2MWM3_9APHY|nr:hypothetical protein EIP91_000895 [Steccherinum ochraceum]
MPLHSRADSGAPYQSLPSEDDANTSLLRRSLDLDDEDALAEELVSQDVHSSGDARIRWIYFVLGAAVLLPWNVIITATPFFLSRLEGTSLKGTFSSYLSMSFTISNFAFLAHATVSADQSTNTRNVFLSIAALTLLTFLFTVSTFIQGPAGLFFAFVILNGVFQAAAGSYLQTSVISVASLFGPTALQAMMAGQAAVGVAVSAVQVVSAASSVRGEPIPGVVVVESNPEERSAFAFFALSTAFLVLSAGAHAWLTRLPSYKAVVGQFSQIQHVARGDAGAMEVDPAQVAPPPQANAEKRDQIARVAKSNLIYNLGVAYVFIATLAVFPPITISIQPTNPSTHPLLFSAVHFLVFNVGDFAGRYAISFPRLHIWSSRRLLVLSLARTLFIPIFLMCNVQRGSSATSSSAIISSDVLYMLILLVFGLSNGYVSSMTLIAAASVEHNPYLKTRVEDVDVTATVASFFLIGGLVVGSFASFGVRAAVCDCNPFYS